MQRTFFHSFCTWDVFQERATVSFMLRSYDCFLLFFVPVPWCGQEQVLGILASFFILLDLGNKGRMMIPMSKQQVTFFCWKLGRLVRAYRLFWRDGKNYDRHSFLVDRFYRPETGKCPRFF